MTLKPVWLAIALLTLPSCSSTDGNALYEPSQQTGTDASPDAPQDATPDTDQDAIDATAPDASVEDVSTAETSPLPDAIPDTTPNGIDCESTDERRFACCTFTAINDYRTSLGLSALVWDPKVAVAAEWYSEYMADLGLFAHGLDGRKVGSRLTDFGVDWTAAGENIARNTTSSWEESCTQVFDQWFGSPSHHALMVSPKYTHGAVGVARGGDWWYATLNVVAY
jgi:uncharacterized protein YkwD